MTTPPLAGCRARIERANESIDYLQGAFDAFLEGHPYEVVAEPDPNPVNRRFRIQSVHPVPDRLRVIVGEVVHHLRSAFDLLLYQLIRSGGGDPETFKPLFPLMRNRGKDYEPSLMGQIQGVSERAAALIKTLQPCEGSTAGKMIAALHDLDLIQKHRLLVALIASAHLPDARFHDGTQTIALGGDAYVALESGAVIILTGRISEVDVKAYLRLTVTLSESGPFKGEPIIKVLVDLSDLTTRTINLFVDEF